MLFVLITTVVLLTALSIYLAKNNNNSKLPPGPRSLPLLGNVLSLVGKVHYIQFGKWARCFGPIFMVKIFGTRLVVISDAKLAREAYSKSQLAAKADVQPFSLYLTGPEQYRKQVGIMGSLGQVWVDQRRFTQKQLREFGFGKQMAMTEHIVQEVSEFMSYLESTRGEVVHPLMRVAEATSNVVWRIVAGERISVNKDYKHLFERAMKKHSDLVESPVAVYLPSVAKFFGKLSGWNELVEASKEIQGTFYNQISQHRNKEEATSSPPCDFMDAYLNKISEEQSLDKESSFNLTNLQAIVSELYISALEPVSVTALWAILYITNFPGVQEKLQEEIDNVIGKDRWPSLEDRINMPYAEAVMNETMRKSSFVSLGLLHVALEDVEVAGFVIPRGTWVCNNHYHIHHDPAVWGDPENFRPERFISVDSTSGMVSSVKFEELIPFSVGKRVCFGEQIARSTIFILLVRLYQQYNTNFDPKSPPPSLEPDSHTLRFPKPFGVVMKDRDS